MNKKIDYKYEYNKLRERIRVIRNDMKRILNTRYPKPNERAAGMDAMLYIFIPELTNAIKKPINK